MPALTRLTIALDKETEEILRKLTNESGMSYSALIRTTLKFFSQYGDLMKDPEKVRLWLNLLTSGEHLILDIDHWALFLKYIEECGKKEEFYEECKNVAKSHAEQLLRVTSTPADYLKRIEACNFYRLSKESDSEFTLVLNSEASKRFIRELLSETMEGMGYKIEIKEDLMKLRVKIL